MVRAGANVTGGLGVAFRIDEAQRAARELDGRFRLAVNGGYGWAVNTHRKAAREVAVFMQQELETAVADRAARTGFSSRETRHLRRALVDPGNRRPLGGSSWLFGFQVGIPQYLMSTPARPYWYRLEKGGEVAPRGDLFKGRHLGFKTGEPRDLINANRGGFRRWPQHIGIARVRNPIPAYGYMEKGGKRGVAWLHGGGLRELYRQNNAPPFR